MGLHGSTAHTGLDGDEICMGLHGSKPRLSLAWRWGSHEPWLRRASRELVRMWACLRANSSSFGVWSCFIIDFFWSMILIKSLRSSIFDYLGTAHHFHLEFSSASPLLLSSPTSTTLSPQPCLFSNQHWQPTTIFFRFPINLPFSYPL